MKEYKDIVKELSKELNMSLVKTREGREGITLSYLEGHTIISQLNRIFGYDGWEYEIVELRETARYKTTKDGKERWNVGFIARVKIAVYFQEGAEVWVRYREDVGYGSGISGDLNTAYESAVKEAVTDALKRASRTLGNQFGNSLYGKANDNGREEVKEEVREEELMTEAQETYIQRLIDEKGLEPELVFEYCEAVLNTDFYELTKRQASILIGDIKSGKVQRWVRSR